MLVQPSKLFLYTVKDCFIVTCVPVVWHASLNAPLSVELTAYLNPMNTYVWTGYIMLYGTHG